MGEWGGVEKGFKSHLAYLVSSGEEKRSAFPHLDLEGKARRWVNTAEEKVELIVWKTVSQLNLVAFPVAGGKYF